MTIKIIGFSFLILTISSTIVFGQSGNKNVVLWSSTEKLKVDDFAIKVSNENSPSFAQFSIDYNVNGFDFLRRNLNKKVRNYIIVSASWIDTTSNVSESLRYQQTLFDLSEIYAREFRKELKENRRKIVFRTKFVEELSQEIMTKFTNRRVIYERETNHGLLTEKQLLWENQIQNELEELKDYALAG